MHFECTCILFLGVPSGLDTIVFNGNRNYGRFMSSHLFSNWKILYSEYTDLPRGTRTNPRQVCKHSPHHMRNVLWCFQPLTILQKDNCSP